MRRLDGIYESALPPHKNALWLDKGVAKYYRNGKWITIIAEDADTNVSWDNVSGKPEFASVATSGSYNDLTDKPTIPAAQVNSDWNATSGVSQILNKPTLAIVATSGSYNDLSDKPNIPAAYVLPAATISTIGGVKKATNVDNLATGAELATVVTKVNAILSALKVADIMVEDAN